MGAAASIFGKQEPCSAPKSRCITIQCSFPAEAFEPASPEVRAFASSLNPNSTLTLSAKGSDGAATPWSELICSKSAWARHSLTLYARFKSEPLSTEVRLPKLSGPALAALNRLITQGKLDLTWPGPELEGICAAVHELQMRCLHGILRQVAEKMLADEAAKHQASPLLRDFMRLGNQYHLLKIRMLGEEQSLRVIPRSALAAHFSGMPDAVLISVTAQKVLVLEGKVDGLVQSYKEQEGRLATMTARDKERDGRLGSVEAQSQKVAANMEWFVCVFALGLVVGFCAVLVLCLFTLVHTTNRLSSLEAALQAAL